MPRLNLPKPTWPSEEIYSTAKAKACLSGKSAICCSEKDILCKALIASRGEAQEESDTVARLETAIRLHRHNVWGDHEVGHSEDVMLYATLSKEESLI